MIQSSATGSSLMKPGDTGEVMADRTAWRTCAGNGWFSAFGKKRGKGTKADPPVHEDLIKRSFTVKAPNRLR